jgi:hypothetical protein
MSGAGLDLATNAGVVSGFVHRAEDQGVDFGPLPPEIDELLQRGVVAYRRASLAGASSLTSRTA